MYRVGLLGAGRISTRHAQVLTSLSDIYTLVGAADIIEQRRLSFSQTYSLPSYSTFSELAINHKPDIAVILTESGNHFRDFCEAIKYCHTIVIEKPLSLSLTDAEKMLSLSNQHSVNLFTVMQNRFNKPIILLKAAMQQNQLGRPITASVRVRWCRYQSYYDNDPWRGTWALDGGVLSNQAIHHVDMLQWLLGPVDSVFAYSKTAMADIECEDTAVVLLNFQNGCLATLEATTCARPHDYEGSISVLAENGVVEVGGIAMNKLLTWQVEGFASPCPLDSTSENPPNVYGYGHSQFYVELSRSLCGLSSSVVTGQDGLYSLQILHAIYKSLETGLPTKLSSSPISKRLGLP